MKRVSKECTYASDITINMCRRKNLFQYSQINKMFPSSHCWRYEFSPLNYPRNIHSTRKGNLPTTLHFIIWCHMIFSHIQLLDVLISLVKAGLTAHSPLLYLFKLQSFLSDYCVPWFSIYQFWSELHFPMKLSLIMQTTLFSSR